MELLTVVPLLCGAEPVRTVLSFPSANSECERTSDNDSIEARQRHSIEEAGMPDCETMVVNV